LSVGYFIRPGSETTTSAEPDHPRGWRGWSLRPARYNEKLQSRTTFGPEISREKICGLLKFLPTTSRSVQPLCHNSPATKQHF